MISDGLNANAVNENLRAVLPPLRRELAAAGLHAGDVDVVIHNGRVRAGYHVGRLTGADAIIHLIGERPGTGLDTMSAYLTYGRDGPANSAGARSSITRRRRRCAASIAAASRLQKRSVKSRG